MQAFPDLIWKGRQKQRVRQSAFQPFKQNDLRGGEWLGDGSLEQAVDQDPPPAT